MVKLSLLGCGLRARSQFWPLLCYLLSLREAGASSIDSSSWKFPAGANHLHARHVLVYKANSDGVTTDSGLQLRGFLTMVGALVEPRVAALGFERQETVRADPYLRGDLRIDPAPQPNRTSNAILVPGYSADETRVKCSLFACNGEVSMRNQLTV